MQRVFFFCCFVALGGCAADLHSEQLTASAQAYERELAACDVAHPGDHNRPVAPRVLCYNRANEARAQREGDADLVRAMTTRMLVEAERYDADDITQTAYDASRAAIFADFNTQMQLRANSRTTAQAAQSQAAAAWLSSLPTTMHCTTFGNQTTCR